MSADSPIARILNDLNAGLIQKPESEIIEQFPVGAFTVFVCQDGGRIVEEETSGGVFRTRIRPDGSLDRTTFGGATLDRTLETKHRKAVGRAYQAGQLTQTETTPGE